MKNLTYLCRVKLNKGMERIIVRYEKVPPKTDLGESNLSEKQRDMVATIEVFNAMFAKKEPEVLEENYVFEGETLADAHLQAVAYGTANGLKIHNIRIDTIHMADNPFI